MRDARCVMRAEPDSSTAAAHTARIRGSYDTVRQQRQQLSATKIPSHPSLDRPTERRNTKNKSEPESQKSQIQIQIQSTQVLPPKSFHPPSTSRPPAHTLTLRRPRAHTPPPALAPPAALRPADTTPARKRNRILMLQRIPALRPARHRPPPAHAHPYRVRVRERRRRRRARRAQLRVAVRGQLPRRRAGSRG